jgi:hypothetical protein
MDILNHKEKELETDIMINEEVFGIDIDEELPEEDGDIGNILEDE